jgi:hypothetical protein
MDISELPPELSLKMNFIFNDKPYWNGEDVMRNYVGKMIFTDENYQEKKLEVC